MMQLSVPRSDRSGVTASLQWDVVNDHCGALLKETQLAIPGDAEECGTESFIEPASKITCFTSVLEVDSVRCRR